MGKIFKPIIVTEEKEGQIIERKLMVNRIYIGESGKTYFVVGGEERKRRTSITKEDFIENMFYNEPLRF